MNDAAARANALDFITKNEFRKTINDKLLLN